MQGMSVTIDITGPPPERVSVVPSSAAEPGMALHALSDPGHHPASRAGRPPLVPP